MKNAILLTMLALAMVACKRPASEGMETYTMPPTASDQLPKDIYIATRTYPVAAGKLYAYNFYYKELNRVFSVDIWTPDGYPASQNRYPVLYMHDGQNCIKPAGLSGQSWQVDRTVTNLPEGILKPVVVMVYSADGTRNADYMPANWWELLPTGKNTITVPGENTIQTANSQAYIDFLTDVLKPFVDQWFMTLSDQQYTLVAGSSMGALVSVYAIQYRPDVFGAAMALSYPALNEWWSWEKRTFLEQMPEANSVRLYIDAGTGNLDNSFFPQYNEIEPMLTEAGWDSEHFCSRVYPGADHNEGAWAARLQIPLQFALK